MQTKFSFGPYVSKYILFLDSFWFFNSLSLINNQFNSMDFCQNIFLPLTSHTWSLFWLFDLFLLCVHLIFILSLYPPSFFHLFLSESLTLFLHSPSPSRSMLSTGNYIIMHQPMKYSFSDTKCVCVCVCVCSCVRGVDDGEAVCVFNKHKTATPYTLTALASNFEHTQAHT